MGQKKNSKGNWEIFFKLKRNKTYKNVWDITKAIANGKFRSGEGQEDRTQKGASNILEVKDMFIILAMVMVLQVCVFVYVCVKTHQIIYLYNLSMCHLLYINCTSVKLF
jgi:hypothetical protein